MRVTPRCPPAAEPGGAGRGHLRTLAAPYAPLRSASAAARRERCPPAPASPPLCPGDARAPAHLRGSAPPPSRFPRGPWRFRTCESGRSAAQKMDAGGWARTLQSAPVRPRCSAGPTAARPPAPTRRPQRRCGPGREASAPRAPPPQSQARTGLSRQRAGPGRPERASRTGALCSFNRTKF